MAHELPQDSGYDVSVEDTSLWPFLGKPFDGLQQIHMAG
jgi:hypothetical protein